MVPLKADTLLRFAEPEVVFRGTITSNYLVLVSIRYIIVVKLIKSVIANPTVGEIKIILSDTVDRHEKDT